MAVGEMIQAKMPNRDKCPCKIFVCFGGFFEGGVQEYLYIYLRYKTRFDTNIRYMFEKYAYKSEIDSSKEK